MQKSIVLFSEPISHPHRYIKSKVGWRRQVGAGNVNPSIVGILMLLKVSGLAEVRGRGSSESEVRREKPWTLSGGTDGGAQEAKKESSERSACKYK